MDKNKVDVGRAKSNRPSVDINSSSITANNNSFKLEPKMATIGVGTAVILNTEVLNPLQTIPTTEYWAKRPKSN